VLAVAAAVVATAATVLAESRAQPTAVASQIPGYAYLNWYSTPCRVGLNLPCGGSNCDTSPDSLALEPYYVAASNATVPGGGVVWAIATSWVGYCDGGGMSAPYGGAWGLVLRSHDVGVRWHLAANDSRLGTLQAYVVTHRVPVGEARDPRQATGGVAEALCMLGGLSVQGNGTAPEPTAAVTCSWTGSGGTEWVDGPPLPTASYAVAAVSYRGTVYVIGGWRRDRASLEALWASAPCVAPPCDPLPAAPWVTVVARAPYGARANVAAMTSFVAAVGLPGATPDPLNGGALTTLLMASGVGVDAPGLVAQDMWTATNATDPGTWVRARAAFPAQLNYLGTLSLGMGEFLTAPATMGESVPLPAVIAASYSIAYGFGGHLTKSSFLLNAIAMYTNTPPTTTTPGAMGLPSGAMVSLVDAAGVSFIFLVDSLSSLWKLYSVVCEPCTAPHTFQASCGYSPFTPSCVHCSDCPGGAYIRKNCTAQVDTTCAPCGTCVAGESFAIVPCTTYAPAQCAACSTCIPGLQWRVANCTPSTNTVCMACTTCPFDAPPATPCSATSNAVCNPIADTSVLSAPQLLTAAYATATTLLATATIAALAWAPYAYTLQLARGSKLAEAAQPLLADGEGGRSEGAPTVGSGAAGTGSTPAVASHATPSPTRGSPPHPSRLPMVRAPSIPLRRFGNPQLDDLVEDAGTTAVPVDAGTTGMPRIPALPLHTAGITPPPAQGALSTATSGGGTKGTGTTPSYRWQGVAHAPAVHPSRFIATVLAVAAAWLLWFSAMYLAWALAAATSGDSVSRIVARAVLAANGAILVVNACVAAALLWWPCRRLAAPAAAAGASPHTLTSLAAIVPLTPLPPLPPPKSAAADAVVSPSHSTASGSVPSAAGTSGGTDPPPRIAIFLAAMVHARAILYAVDMRPRTRTRLTSLAVVESVVVDAPVAGALLWRIAIRNQEAGLATPDTAGIAALAALVLCLAVSIAWSTAQLLPQCAACGARRRNRSAAPAAATTTVGGWLVGGSMDLHATPDLHADAANTRGTGAHTGANTGGGVAGTGGSVEVGAADVVTTVGNDAWSERDAAAIPAGGAYVAPSLPPPLPPSGAGGRAVGFYSRRPPGAPPSSLQITAGVAAATAGTTTATPPDTGRARAVAAMYGVGGGTPVSSGDSCAAVPGMTGAPPVVVGAGSHSINVDAHHFASAATAVHRTAAGGTFVGLPGAASSVEH